MSLLLADILIYILLLAGIGFGGIALMGLLIFPDIRSRMYTAVRASLICAAASAGAALVYALSLVTSGGGDLYFPFMIRVLLLCAVITAAMVTINRMLLAKTAARFECGQAPPSPGEQEKSE